MSTASMKRHDTAARFYSQLTLDGSAIDLTGCRVLFICRSGVTAFADNASIVDPLFWVCRVLSRAVFPDSGWRLPAGMGGVLPQRQEADIPERNVQHIQNP